MNILLINNNPVVSRLLVLCTRDEDMVLEEVVNIENLEHESYDILFVDEALYKGDMQNLNRLSSIQKKVFLSNEDVEISDFDITIKKPFLPSQIIEVLESVTEKEEISMSIFPLSTEIDKEKILNATKEQFEIETNILDGNEIEKIKDLLNMDENEPNDEKEEFSEEEYEARKVKVIKEQLIAEGLEIVNEKEILEELDANSYLEEVTIFKLEENSGKKSKIRDNRKLKEKKKKSQKKLLKFTKKERGKVEVAIKIAMASLKKKQMKKLFKGKKIEISIKLEGNR